MKKTYDKCTPLPASRVGHQLVCGGRGNLYAVGGTKFIQIPNTNNVTDVACTDIHRYSTHFDKWDRLSLDSGAMADALRDPCFYMMNCLISIRQYGEIVCIDIFKKRVTRRVISMDTTREALLGRLCTTQVRSTAVITEMQSDRAVRISGSSDFSALFALIDLEQVVKDHRAQAQTAGTNNDGESQYARSTVSDNEIVVLRCCKFRLAGQICKIIALGTCVDKLLALTHTLDGDLVMFSCKADDFVLGTFDWQMSLYQTGASVGFPVKNVQCAKLCCVKTSKAAGLTESDSTGSLTE